MGNEYIIIPMDIWHDFQEVAISKGLPFSYSIEDSEDGSIEYHLYSHFDIIEDIIWAINLLEVVKLDTLYARELVNMTI